MQRKSEHVAVHSNLIPYYTTPPLKAWGGKGKIVSWKNRVYLDMKFLSGNDRATTFTKIS